MYRKLGITYMTLLLTLISLKSYGQDEFFHELFFEKNILENEKWEFNAEFNSKYTYEEPQWRRWGLAFISVRRIEKLRISGGLNGLYTFNRKIDNFYEVRPWLAVDYGFKIFDHLTFRPRVKTEWRFFIVEDTDTRENYNRTRIQLNFEIPLSKEREAHWMIRPRVEWFFVRNLASAERFSNERDVGITFIRHFKNEHRLLFGYQFEKFFDLDTVESNGHVFQIGYIF